MTLSPSSIVWAIAVAQNRLASGYSVGRMRGAGGSLERSQAGHTFCEGKEVVQWNRVWDSASGAGERQL